MKKWIFWGLALVIGVILMGPYMSQVERPQYTVFSSHGEIEIREYEPQIVAEVQVEGERVEAIKIGFRLLADYIFGNNTAQTEISMTAPVTQESRSEEIAMTAPVIQSGEGNAWTVRFVMPSEYTMKTLPKPNNDIVTLKEVPAKRFVAIRFSGTSSSENIQEYTEKLQAFILEQQLQPQSKPMFAFYNPPWTLPMMRRNEVMVELE